eukprot:SAG11_NODE_6255_length_1351_cov_2.023962_2_plen_273_part_00
MAILGSWWVAWGVGMAADIEVVGSGCEQIVYGGLAMTLPLALLTFDSYGERYILRPYGFSADATFLLRLVKFDPRLLALWAELTLLLAFRTPELVAARALAAVSFGLFALRQHVTVGTHFELLALLALLLLVPFGAGRNGAVALLLRVAAAHHLGAAGALKLAHGAADWTSASTLQLLCAEFCRIAPLRNWVAGPLGEEQAGGGGHCHSWTLSAIGWGGLAFEAVLAPVMLLAAPPGSQLAWTALGALLAFHTGTLLLVSMFFVHNVPVRQH